MRKRFVAGKSSYEQESKKSKERGKSKREKEE